MHHRGQTKAVVTQTKEQRASTERIPSKQKPPMARVKHHHCPRTFKRGQQTKHTIQRLVTRQRCANRIENHQRIIGTVNESHVWCIAAKQLAVPEQRVATLFMYQWLSHCIAINTTHMKHTATHLQCTAFAFNAGQHIWAASMQPISNGQSRRVVRRRCLFMCAKLDNVVRHHNAPPQNNTNATHRLSEKFEHITSHKFITEPLNNSSSNINGDARTSADAAEFACVVDAAAAAAAAALDCANTIAADSNGA